MVALRQGPSIDSQESKFWPPVLFSHRSVSRLWEGRAFLELVRKELGGRNSKQIWKTCRLTTSRKVLSRQCEDILRGRDLSRPPLVQFGFGSIVYQYPWWEAERERWLGN